MENLLPLEIAASMLGVCKQTLRRWDATDKLKAVRASNGYRFYDFLEVQRNMPVEKAKPFLKWAGGKSQSLPYLLAESPREYECYIEPFLGGGALFFALQPEKAKLNDSNSELINTYGVVRDAHEELIQALIPLKKAHSKDHYYEIRALDPKLLSKTERAARFVYLNKTCFNGLHRVNKQGQFNVPIGSYKNPNIIDEKNIVACSNALQGVELYNLDYVEFLRAHASKGSFVYLDPPYIPVSEYSDFDRYTEGKFGTGNQIELAQIYRELVRKGAYAVLSNSSSELAEKLYSDFRSKRVFVPRAINKVASKRGGVEELLVSPKEEKEVSFPSTRFMGSKNNLLPYISQELSKVNVSTILDACSGSGVVSYHLKKLGYEVISNDFLTYSSKITTALVENNSTRLDANDISALLKKNRRTRKFVQTTFKDLYFSDLDNAFLDNTLANLRDIGDKYKKALALSALSRACLKRRPRGIFTYVGFKYDDGRKDLSFSLREHFIFAISEFNNAVFDNGKKNASLNGCVTSLNNISPDLIYLDPPYFSKHSDNDYVRRYHFIEGLCKEWEGLDIQHETKTKKFKKYGSPFDSKVGTYKAFNEIFQRFKNSKFLISYSSNSLPSKEEIFEMLEASGKKVTLTEIDYKYSFGNQGHKKNDNNNAAQEYLFLAA